MKEAMFWKELEDNKVQCSLCARNCIIPRGDCGFCKVRKNEGGKLYTLVYDKVSSAAPNRVEKKPLYNFAPGTMAFSYCTPGCNWRCLFCCNYILSQESKESKIEGKEITPEELVKKAKSSNCEGISHTFTEPTIFYELSYEVAKLAHEQGLYNSWVTNGYTNVEPIKKIAPYLDAVTVDFKGSNDPEFLKKYSSVPSPEPIYRALKEYKKQGIHIEITDLLVPEVGDSMDKVKESVEWIKENLGEDTPLHFLRFFPNYKMSDFSPTPKETLEKAYEIAKDKGMKYVYLGNIGNSKNNTYCPECGELLIRRTRFGATKYYIRNGKCPECGEKINIKGINWIPEIK